jgi:hypothetical protein
MIRGQKGLEGEIEELKVLGLQEEALMPKERSLNLHYFPLIS